MNDVNVIFCVYEYYVGIGSTFDQAFDNMINEYNMQKGLQFSINKSILKDVRFFYGREVTDEVDKEMKISFTYRKN